MLDLRQLRLKYCAARFARESPSALDAGWRVSGSGCSALGGRGARGHDWRWGGIVTCGHDTGRDDVEALEGFTNRSGWQDPHTGENKPAIQILIATETFTAPTKPSTPPNLSTSNPRNQADAGIAPQRIQLIQHVQHNPPFPYLRRGLDLISPDIKRTNSKKYSLGAHSSMPTSSTWTADTTGEAARSGPAPVRLKSWIWRRLKLVVMRLDTKMRRQDGHSLAAGFERWHEHPLCLRACDPAIQPPGDQEARTTMNHSNFQPPPRRCRHCLSQRFI
jgi:hypothetical protein